MPKIIDHDAYRREIAEKAARVFSRHGYSSLGMRQIAKETGISKSALYHYFPGKEELFAASTHVVLSRDLELFRGIPNEQAQKLSPAEKADLFIQVLHQMEPEFDGELRLLSDYISGKSPAERSRDPLLQKAIEAYTESFSLIFGPEHARPLYNLLMGALLNRWLYGDRSTPDELKKWVSKILEQA
jgi:AcrR family transcriptional regulator